MDSFLQPNLQPKKPEDDSFDIAIECIKDGQFSAAFQILNNGSNNNGLNAGRPGNERPDTIFALGCCFYKAEEYAKAAEHFEQALSGLRQIRPTSPSMGMSTSISKSETYRKLRKDEMKRNMYLVPFKLSQAERNPEITTENVMVAAATAFFKAGDKERAKKLINVLNGEEFNEIKSTIINN